MRAEVRQLNGLGDVVVRGILLSAVMDSPALFAFLQGRWYVLLEVATLVPIPTTPTTHLVTMASEPINKLYSLHRKPSKQESLLEELKDIAGSYLFLSLT